MAFRIGHGYDIHRLQPGGKLVLGGVVVSTEMSPIAHSDGDVVIHAIVDALLGAICSGDIGDMFPNSDPQWKNADSRLFLNVTLKAVKSKQMSIANIDVTILAERPKLGPKKREIEENLWQLTGAPVNVKAGTNEGCDAVGRGEAIACHAVVLLTTGN